MNWKGQVIKLKGFKRPNTVRFQNRQIGVHYTGPRVLKVQPQTSSSSIIWNLWEMQTHPRPTESDILGVEPSSLGF